MVRILGGDEDPLNEQTYLIAKYSPEKLKLGELDWKELNKQINFIKKLTAGYPVTAYGLKPTSHDVVKVGLRIQDIFGEWIDDTVGKNGSVAQAWPVFRFQWKISRAWVPLQVRLCAEQYFYDRGDPWRYLVTGFGAIKED